MVDYAISIFPDGTLHTSIVSKLRTERLPWSQTAPASINHTKAEYTRFKPIVIGIETKRQDVDGENGKIQLGMWAMTHFRRLQQLSKLSFEELSILPQVIVQGHDWRLKIASVTQKGDVILHGDIPIGNTRNVLGIYTLMAVLRYLCQWAVITYKPWFIDCCLQPE